MTAAERRARTCDIRGECACEINFVGYTCLRHQEMAALFEAHAAEAVAEAVAEERARCAGLAEAAMQRWNPYPEPVTPENTRYQARAQMAGELLGAIRAGVAVPE